MFETSLLVGGAGSLLALLEGGSGCLYVRMIRWIVDWCILRRLDRTRLYSTMMMPMNEIWRLAVLDRESASGS